MWGRKRRPVVPDDTGEAMIIRGEAARDRAEVHAQQSEVDSLARRLERRRQLNHFGEDLRISFAPRHWGGRT